MLEMLCTEHQLVIFKEVKEHWQELEQMDQRNKLKRNRKRTTPGEWNDTIDKKKKAQLKAYQLQRQKISALNESS